MLTLPDYLATPMEETADTMEVGATNIYILPSLPHVLQDGHKADTQELDTTKYEHINAVAKARCDGGYLHEVDYNKQHAAGFDHSWSYGVYHGIGFQHGSYEWALGLSPSL